MITAPASDIVLDEVQSKKIEVAGHKLSVIETEVVIANRNLKVLKDDIVKATLEYKELEEKIAVADSVLSEKKAEKDKVTALVVEATNALQKANESAKEILSLHEAKAIELSEREAVLGVQEYEVSLEKEKSNKDRIELEKSKAEVESVKEAFSAVTLPWK